MSCFLKKESDWLLLVSDLSCFLLYIYNWALIKQKDILSD